MCIFKISNIFLKKDKMIFLHFKKKCVTMKGNINFKANFMKKQLFIGLVGFLVLFGTSFPQAYATSTPSSS